MIDTDALWAKLDAAGEDGVRRKLAERAFREDKIPLVEEWLAVQARRRHAAGATALSVQADESSRRSAEANSIAREGNRIAARSNIAAWVAVAISVAALGVAIYSACVDAQR